MTRSLVALSTLALVGCNGISYPSAPAPGGGSSATAAVASIVLTPERATLPEGGGTTRVNVFTASRGASTAQAPNARVSLHATTGTLSAADVTTDWTGNAKVEWSGNQTGEIIATSGEVVGRVTITVERSSTGNPGGGGGGGGTGGGGGGGNPVTITLGISLASGTTTYVGEPTRFEASILDTVPGEAIAWDFNADGIEDARGRQVAWTFTAPGDVLVGAKATLGDGSVVHANGIRFPVRHRPPDASATLSVNDATVQRNTPQRFTVSVTGLASDESITSIEWDFGQGAPIINTSVVQEFTYTTAGTKNPRVTIRTTYGRGIVASTFVTVLN